MYSAGFNDGTDCYLLVHHCHSELSSYKKPESALWNITVMIAHRLSQMMSSVSFHALVYCKAINGALVVNPSLTCLFHCVHATLKI